MKEEKKKLKKSAIMKLIVFISEVEKEKDSQTAKKNKLCND